MCAAPSTARWRSAPRGTPYSVAGWAAPLGCSGMAPRRRPRGAAPAPAVAVTDVDPPADEGSEEADPDRRALPEKPADLSDEGARAPSSACASLGVPNSPCSHARTSAARVQCSAACQLTLCVVAGADAQKHPITNILLDQNSVKDVRFSIRKLFFLGRV